MIQLHIPSRRSNVPAAKFVPAQPATGDRRSINQTVLPTLPILSGGDSVHFGSSPRRHCTPTLQRIFNDSLVYEAANGNAARVRSLLASYADINHANLYHGKTALMQAAENEKTDVLHLLIRHRANLEKTDYDHRTALQLAARSGKVESLRILLEAGAKTAATDRQGMNALLLAVNNNRKAAMEFLLDQGFDIESKNYMARTPLQVAAERGHTELVKTLIARQANLESRSFEEMTPLMLAAREGRLQVVKALLEAGADINARNHFGMTPLMLAARKGHKEVMNLLLDYNADVRPVSNQDETALTFAVGNEEIVKRMMARGADPGRPNRSGITPLMEAVRLGYEGSVKALLTRPDAVNINRTDDTGHSALTYALDRGAREGIIRLLLQVPGLDIESRDSNGNTPLLLATRRNYNKSAQLLLEHGANVNAVSPQNTSALHVASSQGNHALVKTLLDHGADIYALNLQGKTSLLLAAYGSHGKVIDLLLQRQGTPQPHPYTHAYAQFHNYMDHVAFHAGLNRQSPFRELLPNLANADLFRLTEPLYMAQEHKPLAGLKWVAQEEMNAIIDSSRQYGNAEELELRNTQREIRDQGWRNLEFLARHNVDMQPAVLAMALARKQNAEHRQAILDRNKAEKAMKEKALKQAEKPVEKD